MCHDFLAIELTKCLSPVFRLVRLWSKNIPWDAAEVFKELQRSYLAIRVMCAICMYGVTYPRMKECGGDPGNRVRGCNQCPGIMPILPLLHSQLVFAVSIKQTRQVLSSSRALRKMSVLTKIHNMLLSRPAISEMILNSCIIITALSSWFWLSWQVLWILNHSRNKSS